MVEEVKLNQTKEKKRQPILDFSIKTLNGMAYGLFATLIVGTIMMTLGNFFPHDSSASLFSKEMYSLTKSLASCLQMLTGAGIGIGIALALEFDSLKTIVLASTGEIAAYFSLSTKFVTDGYKNIGAFQIGDPLTIYFVVIIVALLMKLVLKKKTPVDILIIPLFGVTIGFIISLLIRYPLIYVTYAIQYVVDKATIVQPILMGIIVSVIMGMALTAPISSAAIAAMVFIGEGEGLALASGAAIVGCSVQMIGFAIQSRKDNSLGIILSIGIGTSMLQFKNILKKPIIWLPTIIASAILGPLSTTIFKIKCMGSSAGMGTAGLVGQIGSFQSMGVSWLNALYIIGMEIILPLVLVFVIDLLFRKFKLIKDGDFRV